MTDMLVRVAGTVLGLNSETEVLFSAGIDDLEHAARVGGRFSVEVEVVEREGNRVTARIVGLPAIDP